MQWLRVNPLIGVHPREKLMLVLLLP